MAEKILLVTHLHREDVANAAESVRAKAACVGVEIIEPGSKSIPDMVLGLGGDGTFLAAAEFARQWDVPLLGMNFGHMGFLAETSGDESIGDMVERLAADDYRVATRMTLQCTVVAEDGTEKRNWALNEVAVLHTDMAHPADVVFAVDGQAVSTYATDGIVIATPTGSTAYSFSAGGPVVWPNVEAIVMAPLAAHGLFTRPLVVGPDSELVVGILPQNRLAPMVWFDGRRHLKAPPGSRVVVRHDPQPLKLVRLENTPFSARLVTKFALPVDGWRTNWDGSTKKSAKATGNGDLGSNDAD